MEDHPPKFRSSKYWKESWRIGGVPNAFRQQDKEIEGGCKGIVPNLDHSSKEMKECERFTVFSSTHLQLQYDDCQSVVAPKKCLPVPKKG